MQFEVLTKEEFNLALNGLKAELLSEIKNMVTAQDGKDWISGAEAQGLLGCKSTKLSEMTVNKTIIKRGTGKGSLYSKRSIVTWLNRK